MMGHVLKWVEDHSAADVTTEGLYSLTNFLDEGPFVINHSVWALQRQIDGQSPRDFLQRAGLPGPGSLETNPQACAFDHWEAAE